MTIYIDIVLIENLIMNYIILFTTAVVLKIKVNHIRLILASLLGAGYSIIAYMGIIKVYSSIILKIILSVLIIYIAFNPQNIKKMCKDLLLFYLVSFVFGGATFALIYIIKPQNILMKNGLFLGTYTLKTVMLGAVVAFCIIIGAFAIIKNKISKKDMFCEIEILINQKKIKTKAMIDTGNMLKEPITNVPVIVVEHILLYSCMPKEILNNLKEIMGGDFKNIPCDIQEKYISKLKLIPFSSLGKQNGMLIGIRPEYVKVITDEQEKINIGAALVFIFKKINKNVIIGIYEKSLTKKGEYQALIGIELL